MIPVLLILGAGAALEIKRLTQRTGGHDQRQADKERHLKELLQVGWEPLGLCTLSF